MSLLGSLQARLALALGLGLVVLWMITTAITGALVQHEMDEVFDSALQETAQRILPLAVLEILNRDAESTDQRLTTLHQHEEFFTYVVRDADGRVLLRSHNAQETDFPAFEAMGFTQSETHRFYFDAALQGSITIAVAEPMTHRDKIAREALLRLGLPVLFIIPFGLIGVFWIVRRSLRPVRQFSADLARRGAGDLSTIPQGDLPDEIRPVAGAVNALLDRLGRTLEAERSFTSNAAHELRTPVAAALAQTQRMISETSDPAAARRGADIEASLKRLTRLSEKLLQLARAEGARLRRDEATDLRAVLNLVTGDFERINSGAHGGGTKIVTKITPEAVLSTLDPDSFAIVARNLIENALRHGGEAPIEVTLDAMGVLRVCNGGPAVAPEDIARLSARFERGATQAEGSGLGLSIVGAIAAGAQAGFAIYSPARGRVDGFEAIFEIPVTKVA